MVVRDTQTVEITESGEDVFIMPVDDRPPSPLQEKEDVFLMKAPKMIQALIKDAEGSPSLALHRLMRHIHHIGEYAPNTASLRLAKIRLEELAAKSQKKM